jgi:Na+-transporting methylmalonyl-CoA/oxaloacetate decarboxylase gamma subunit
MDPRVVYAEKTWLVVFLLLTLLVAFIQIRSKVLEPYYLCSCDNKGHCEIGREGQKPSEEVEA